MACGPISDTGEGWRAHGCARPAAPGSTPQVAAPAVRPAVRSPGRIARSVAPNSARRGLQPTHEAEGLGWVREVTIEVNPPNLGSMLPGGGGSCGIVRQATYVADAELRSHIRDSVLGHVGRLIQERAQEPRSGQLEGEPELVVYTTPDVEQLEVSVIQVEVAGQLLSLRRSDGPAVRLLTVGREEFDWHGAGHYTNDSSSPYPISRSAPTIQPELDQNP